MVRMRRPRPNLAWPYLVGLAVLVAIPLAGAVGLAFTDFNGFERPTFTGLANFRRLFAA